MAVTVVVVLAGLMILGFMMSASNSKAVADLHESCKTEGTAQYRGAVDNDRVKDWIDTCR